MSSVFGSAFKISTFGESHGVGVGVVVDGCPAGLALTEAAVQKELDRRRPGQSDLVTPRNEADRVEILSGVRDGRTLGSPVAMLVRNRAMRSRDYDEIAELFRPGHADYTYFRKYGIPTQAGGGRSSGRETIGRVAGGAVAKILLAESGIRIAGWVRQIGTARAAAVDRDYVEGNPLRCADPAAFAAMKAQVEAARDAADSVGGIVEVVASGVPAGLGEPVFDKLDACLGGALFSIGAVKGVEIGAGFAAAAARGSENNDEMTAEGFVSNHAGGILGGISTGADIVVRLAVKPPASIAREQRTIDRAGNEKTICTHGRHDPCICPRVVPVAEAMCALVLADAFLVAHGRSHHFGG